MVENTRMELAERIVRAAIKYRHAEAYSARDPMDYSDAQDELDFAIADWQAEQSNTDRRGC